MFIIFTSPTMVAVDISLLQEEQTQNVDTRTTKLQDVMQLFSSHHRYTPERFKWLWFWLNDRDSKGNMSCYEDRIQFLRAVWKEYSIFRPFDTVESSEEYIKEHTEFGFILRLSTTQPGKITYTRRSTKTPDKVIHTRFTLLKHGKIDATICKFDNIYALVTDLSNKRLQQSLAHQPGHYVYMQ